MNRQRHPEGPEMLLLPRALASKIFELTGEHYLRSLPEIIVRDMDLLFDHAFVGELAGKKRIRTLSLYTLDHFGADVEYDLDDTPCDFVIGKRACVYPHDVQTLFPNDAALARMAAQSYVGIPLFSSAGKPLGLIAAVGRSPIPEDRQTDITGLLQIFGARAAAELERKHAEEKLKKSEENYRSIFNAANDAIFVHDINTGEVVSVNEKTREMYGRSLEEFRNFGDESLSAAVPPYTAREAFQWIRRAASGPPQLFEWLAKNKNGELFWIEVNLKRAEIGGQTRLLALARDITDRKKAEEKFTLTQFSVDHASVSAFLVREDGRFMYVNEQACRTLGYTREELLSMGVYDIDPAPPFSSWNERWKQIKKERFLHFETAHRKKDGTLVPMDMSINYLSFAGREYNVAFGLDVSKRKRAEHELRQAYKLLKTILDSMSDPISLIDVRNFSIVSVNKVFLRSYGYSDESEVMGKQCYEITHRRSDVCSPPDDICPLIETVKTRDHFTVDHVHYDKRGNKIYMEVSTSPIRDEAGNVVQVVHVQRNITERKLAEEALRESEERFRAFFELAAVGAVQVDPVTGQYLRVNDHFCRMTGYSREELLSKSFRDVTHPDERERDASFFEAIRKGEIREYTVEKRYVHKDGHAIWAHVSAAVIRDNRGKPVQTAAIIQDITDRKRMEDEIRHLAHHDVLTGLPNRRLFNDIAGVKLVQAERDAGKLAVLFLDLDRFKEINDTLGHEAGDELLRQVASRLKSILRRSDGIGRLGGDEFSIILGEIERTDDVAEIAKKIVGGFESPFQIAGRELQTTTSVGISIHPDDGKDMETLLRQADTAMYHAKESGGNTYRFHDPSINIRSIERRRLEQMLRRSLEFGEMVLYYQPQFDVTTGGMMCAEALLRWRHPERGLLLPGDFMTEAEESGFIIDIDEWVLSEVCRQIRSWQDSGFRAPCVTVNLSGRQLQNPELMETIESILKKTGISADFLHIEVPESMAMSDVEHTRAVMDQLAAKGIHFSIDGFGTGYSSLIHLKRMPVEKLKIDRSFIRDIAVDRNGQAVIQAATALAHSMNMKVIAEGVETREQLSFLAESGCDEAQGFLLGRPMPAEELEEMMMHGA